MCLFMCSGDVRGLLVLTSLKPQWATSITAGERSCVYHYMTTTIIILSHWGRVTHVCVRNLICSGPDNGLSPGRCQAIIWTNVGILLIGPIGTKFNFNRNSNNFLEGNAFEHVCEMAVILFRPQCVNVFNRRIHNNCISVTIIPSFTSCIFSFAVLHQPVILLRSGVYTN